MFGRIDIESRKVWRLAALAAPGMLFILLFFVVPIGLLLSSAFTQVDLVTYQVTDHFTFSQFSKFLGDAYYLEIMWNTLSVAAVTAVVCLVLGYPYALYMSRCDGAERRILMLIAFSPLLVSLVILNFGWIVIFSPRGLVNNLLISWGLSSSPLRLLYTREAVVVGLVHHYLPYMILAIENSLRTINPDVPRAAVSLGASRVKVFSQVTFPLSISGIVSGSVIVFSLSASAFVTPVFLGGAGFKTMASEAYRQVMTTLNIPFGAAITLILLVLTAIVVMGMGWVASLITPKSGKAVMEAQL